MDDEAGGLTGVINLGNTCFLNASLHTVFNNPFVAPRVLDCAPVRSSQSKSKVCVCVHLCLCIR